MAAPRARAVPPEPEDTPPEVVDGEVVDETPPAVPRLDPNGAKLRPPTPDEQHEDVMYAIKGVNGRVDTLFSKIDSAERAIRGAAVAVICILALVVLARPRGGGPGVPA